MIKLYLIILSLSLFACQQRTDLQQLQIDQGVSNSSFNPNVPDGNGGFDGSNTNSNSNTSSADKPNSSSERGNWSGELASIGDTDIQAIGGGTLKFDQLQNDKDFLVIGLYKSDCPLCIEKAKIFNADQNKIFFQNSEKCQYVGIIQGDPSNKDMQEFASEYGFQFEGSAKNDLRQSNLISSVLREGFEFPTTIVVDIEGNVIETFNKDLGPQIAVSYCR